MERQIISVTELNLYIKAKLDGDPLLSGLLVRGEISNFKRYSSGHCYFTLKDAGGAVRAVMFNSSAQRLKFAPTDGMKVIACGRASVYERDGQYQLYITSLEPDGIGALSLAYEQLKEKLAGEGLFDESIKKPVPRYPRRIGVITSPTGAAVRDIINIAGRRFPLAEICVYPAVVQGEGSVPTLLAGLEYFGFYAPADVIIIGRGGGSIEDLWSFNSEALARKIRSSPVPVISAVGHETDFTICDFAADLRAPTPSAAAEIAVPDSKDTARQLRNVQTRLCSLLGSVLAGHRHRLELLASSRAMSTPRTAVDEKRMSVARLDDKLVSAAETAVMRARGALETKSAALAPLNPLAILARGYGAAFGKDGKLIKSVEDIPSGERFSLRLSDGTMEAEKI